jgi:hypothetical protein
MGIWICFLAMKANPDTYRRSTPGVVLRTWLRRQLQHQHADGRPEHQHRRQDDHVVPEA